MQCSPCHGKLCFQPFGEMKIVCACGSSFLPFFFVLYVAAVHMHGKYWTKCLKIWYSYFVHLMQYFSAHLALQQHVLRKNAQCSCTCLCYPQSERNLATELSVEGAVLFVGRNADGSYTWGKPCKQVVSLADFVALHNYKHWHADQSMFAWYCYKNWKSVHMYAVFMG